MVSSNRSPTTSTSSGPSSSTKFVRSRWRLGLGFFLLCTGSYVINMDQSSSTELFPNPLDAALADAAAAGARERVEALVKSGANVNAVGRDGVTPLLWALSAQNKRGVASLLDFGANPNYVAPSGFSPISLASGFDDPDFLRSMLAHGGDPNMKSGVGEPILHTAITSERWLNVEILLDNGADINSRSATGMTPALLCAYLDDYEKVAYFLRRGADHTLVANNGSTLANEIDLSRLRPDSERGEWLQRVRSMLMDRGVRFPAPPPAEVRARVAREKA